MPIVKSIAEINHIPKNSLCLFYFDQSILVLKSSDKNTLPYYRDIHFEINTTCALLTQEQDISILALDLAGNEVPPHFSLENTRKIYHEFNLFERQAIAKTFGIIYWYRMHRYCSRCQNATIFDAQECALLCNICQHYYYPKTNPSIIVLVNRGRELLLARSPHFPPGVYSALAGYVSPGETPEETIVREVKEEVNLEVKNIRYAYSQSWPFPDTLMLGFYAQYAGGELKIDEKEIEAAAWFTPENLPKLPRQISIAWQLIHGFIQSLDSSNSY